MSENKQSYMKSAAILAATAIVVKIISGIYKIPLYNMIGDEGTGHFQVTYTIFTLLFTISTAGIPVALSRQISAAVAVGQRGLVRRYFSMALPAFAVVGAFFSVVMFIYADKLALFMNDGQATAAIRILSPAVFFVCVVSVYEGYGQGHENMYPTAAKQLLEVSCKLIFGLSIVWFLLRAGYPSPVVTAGAISGVTIGLGLALPVMVYFKRKIDRTFYRNRKHDDAGTTDSRRHVLLSIFRVSIPITLGASFMNILTLLDTKFVLLRLQTGAGFAPENAVALYGVYSKGLSLLVLPSFLIVPITISIIPAVSAALATHRYQHAKEVMASSMKLTNLFAMPAGVGLCILAYPIFNVLYPHSNPVGPTLLSIFGIAAYFVCMQLMTTALLQASGREKIPLFTFPVGGIIQIVLDWVLVGNPSIGIIGSPIGTLTCYFIITVLNFVFIAVTVRHKPNFAPAFIKPALCTAAMGVTAWSVYELLAKVGAKALGTGHLALAVYLTGAIVAAVVVYGALVIATKTVTREDMKFVPKGEIIASFLKIK
ncbi:polysaccharide biosynthesis protein [Oscillospiraceae bacterium WX1]